MTREQKVNLMRNRVAKMERRLATMNESTKSYGAIRALKREIRNQNK